MGGSTVNVILFCTVDLGQSPALSGEVRMTQRLVLNWTIRHVD